MKETLKPLQHPIKQGIYRHYSGNLYEVIGTARHSETLEELIIYKDVHKPELLWARPAAMFLEIVTYNDTPIQRFTFVK